MTAHGRPGTWRHSAWRGDPRRRVLLGLVLVAGVGLAVAAGVRGVTIAASAYVTPSSMFLADSGAEFVVTVTNTGTSSLGAVEIERPANGWSVVACPTGPAGWVAQQDSNKCRYRSADGSGDDLASGASSSAFRVRASATGGPRDRTGTWKVRVSQTNSFSNPNVVVAASAAPPGLGNVAHTWQILDAVVASAAVTPGSACPASNREALTSTTQTIVICGRNRSSQAHTPSAALSTLGGTFIASPGTFSSASIPAQGTTSVVLGNWVGATVSASSGTDRTVVALIRSATDETSPSTTIGGYHAVNRPPAAGDDTSTTDEDTAAAIDVLANDTDPESQSLTVTAIDSAATTGLVTSDGTGVTYDPDGRFDSLAPGEQATDTFVYTVSDGHGGSDTAAVTVTVTGVNDDPDAVDDAGLGFSTDEETPFTTPSVLANDTDAEGDTISVVGLDDSSTLGTVTDNGDGTFGYDPAGAFGDLGASESATDTFAYTASDGNGGTDTATVTLTIEGVNTPPTAVDDAYTGVVGNTQASLGTTAAGPTVALAGDLLGANDSDPDDTNLSASLVNATAGADVTVNPDGSFVYVPPVGLVSATDTFSYRITDPSGASDEATVRVTVGSDIVWYVDSASPGAGDGRSIAPFTTLAPLRGTGDADGPGAILFLYGRSGSYGGGLALEADQELIGQPAGLTVGGHSVVAAGGSRPVVTNTAGTGVTLANGVAVRSIRVDGAAVDGIAGVNVMGVTISDILVAGSGRHGIHATGSGTGSVGLTVADSTLSDNVGTGLLVRGSGATTGTVTATRSVFDGNGAGVNLVAILADSLTFTIGNNSFVDQLANSIQVITSAPPTGTPDSEVIRGTIRDNTIGGSAAGSGSRDLIGIAIDVNGDADAVIAVTGNVISHTDQEGIFAQARLDNDGDTDTGRLDLTVRDNTVATPDDDSAFPLGSVHGIRLESRNTTTVCLDVAGNASASAGSGSGFRVRQRDSSTFNLERFTGAGSSDADVIAFLVAQNAAGSTASATHATSFTGAVDGACRQP